MAAGDTQTEAQRVSLGMLAAVWVGVSLLGACSLDLSGRRLSPTDVLDASRRSNASPSSDAGPSDADRGPGDAALDSARDAGPDAALDAAPDSAADAAPDSAADAAPDSAADAAREATAGGDGAMAHACEGVDCSHLDGECTRGVCHGASGLCQRVLLPLDTACGDPGDDACDAQDTCDGLGHCIDRRLEEGDVCGESDTVCTLDPVCDGAGRCRAGEPAPAGTDCGGGTTSDCHPGDACDGAGRCVPEWTADGTPCSDCAGGDCTPCNEGICESAGCIHQRTDALDTNLCIGSSADLPCPDLRTTGTAVQIGDSSVSLLFLIGFDFAIFGKPVTGFAIHADGVLRLAADALTLGEPRSLSDYDGAAPLVAAYWDDLVGDPDGAGSVYWQLQGSGDSQQLVVQWASQRKGAGDVDVRAVLHENTNVIELCYVDTDVGDPSLDSGASAAVGIVSAGGHESFQSSFDEPAVPSGTYLRYEPSALLFEGFEGLTTLRDVDGWEFPFSTAPFATTTADAAGGVYSLDHSEVQVGGFATHALPSTITRGVLRIEADVRMDVTGIASTVQLALVSSGTAPTVNRPRAALTLYPDSIDFYAGVNPSTTVDHGPDVDVWRHVVLEVDLDAHQAHASYGDEDLGTMHTTFTAFDAIKLILGPNNGVMRLDNLLVTHDP